MTAEECFLVFQRSIDDYHQVDHVDAPMKSPYGEETFEDLLYRKNWIDTVQWHLEDIIRNPDIDPVEGLTIKRRIDRSNQDRTDIVEKIDDYFLDVFKDVKPGNSARLNSETPAWLLDRMSILQLKIFHMREQTLRTDATDDHIARCKAKLDVLLEQQGDMKTAFDELMEDIRAGRRRFKVYRQMKMYNDSTLNPVLYSEKKNQA